MDFIAAITNMSFRNLTFKFLASDKLNKHVLKCGRRDFSL
jgi:hypothetical protein